MITFTRGALSPAALVVPVVPMSAITPEISRRAPLIQVLKHRNYRLFFWGQLLSQMGLWMHIVAQSWLVYRLTGSPLMLGVTGFLAQAPILFFAVFGGAIADRMARRKLLIITQAAYMLQATILTVLAFTGAVEMWHLIVLALSYGLITAIDTPTRQAFTLELVGRADLQSAIALNAIMFNGARVIGPAIAGVVIGITGEAWCFAINAASYSAVLISLVLMRMAPAEAKGQRSGALNDLIEGFQYVARHREIRTALIVLAVASFAGGPYLTLMLAFANDVLKATSEGYGLLMATVGAGALLGAVAMNRLSAPALRYAPSAAAVGLGIFMTAFSLSRDLGLAATLVLPTSFFLMLQGSSTNITLQSAVGDRMRGRVMAYYTMAFMGMIPFGGLAAGALATVIGTPLTLAIGGTVCALSGAVSLILRRRAG